MQDIMKIKGDFDTAVKFSEAWEAATHAHVTGITALSTGFAEIHFEYDESVSDIEEPEKCDDCPCDDTRFIRLGDICVWCDERPVEIGHLFCAECEAERGDI